MHFKMSKTAASIMPLAFLQVQNEPNSSSAGEWGGNQQRKPITLHIPCS